MSPTNETIRTEIIKTCRGPLVSRLQEEFKFEVVCVTEATVDRNAKRYYLKGEASKLKSQLSDEEFKLIEPSSAKELNDLAYARQVQSEKEQAESAAQKRKPGERPTPSASY